jgi:tetratricopeptide (TPR) repeat protein
MALDLAALWDYSKPALSEERFRAEIVRAAPDDAFILQTQIARTWGLRKDFVKAREILASVEPKLDTVSAEAKVRWLLEMGRTWSSPAHTKDQRTPEAKDKARGYNLRAFETAKQASLDSLAIDALHMMVMVDEAPQQQLEWNMKAIAFMEASTQPAAKKWAGALYNNVGYAHHEAGRDDLAIDFYRKSLAAYEAAGRDSDVRIEHWMIANALRTQGKLQEALAIQQSLEREWDAAGEPDPYVYEELESLHRALGDEKLAQRYAARRAALKKQ